MTKPLSPTPNPSPARAGKRVGAQAAWLSFWFPFAGASLFILAVWAGATQAAGHPILMYAVIGITTLVFAGGLALGIAGLRRMREEGRRGILTLALSGAALNGVLLGLMLLLTGYLIYDAQRKARAMENAAELEARELTARVGGGAALEKALAANASQNFAAALRQLQGRYDDAWAALTNPPVLEMAAVQSRAELQAREEKVRRLIQAAKNLGQFAENTRDIYEQELQRHKLPPASREAELRQFMAEIAPVNPSIIALRRAEVREGESLLRVVRLFEQNWGRWEYRPATGDILFKKPELEDAYNVAHQEFDEVSRQAQSLKRQLRSGGQ
jgi:hypothetical protein